jgi:hypothetical protein
MVGGPFGDSIANESVSLFLLVAERSAGVTERKGRMPTTPNVIFDWMVSTPDRLSVGWSHGPSLLVNGRHHATIITKH